MLLDPVALAWASWIGLGIGVLGTLVSLIGLTLTFREARRARDAAQAAQVEVEKVLAVVRSRNRLSALSATVQQADTISLRIRDGSLSREQITTFRRAVMEALAITSFGAAKVILPDDPVAISLDRLATLHGNPVDWTKKRAQMQVELNKVTSFLISQEANARTEDQR